MNKLTTEESILTAEDILSLSNIIRDSKYNNTQGQQLLNKIIMLNCFVKEIYHCLNTANMTEGKMSDRTIVSTDYGYIKDFVNDLDNLIQKRL